MCPTDKQSFFNGVYYECMECKHPINKHIGNFCRNCLDETGDEYG